MSADHANVATVPARPVARARAAALGPVVIDRLKVNRVPAARLRFRRYEVVKATDTANAFTGQDEPVTNFCAASTPDARAHVGARGLPHGRSD
jgi:hypothetical protein